MPAVSIIVPCYNEQNTIVLLLDAIRNQTYPLAELEVVIADGFSQDETRQRINAYQQAHPDLSVRLVDNPRRHIPAGLNQAIRAAQGSYIVRLDAHSVPQPNYVETCIRLLQAGKGDNVGGVWEIQPQAHNGRPPGWIARSIAAAAAHPFGVGDALYRYAAQAQEVDTAPFGAFKRSLFDQIGYYDETLLTNEDYEFNTRLRQQGGRVWLDPSIRSVYFARPTLGALARQYARYGYWKARMLARYPRSLRWRQALPPLFVASLIVLLALCPWFIPARWLLGLQICLYLGILVAGSFQAARARGDAALLVGVPLAIACMHLAWGGALLWSAATLPFSRPIQRLDTSGADSH